MIYSITPNPAIDRNLVIPGFCQVGGVFRATQEMVTVGGKGLNLARAVKFLGGQAIGLAFLGGHTGRYFAALADEEGLSTSWTWLVEDGETRTCSIVLDDQGGEPTVLNTNGPTATAGDWEHLAQDILQRAAPGDRVTFNGSLLPGSPIKAYTQLIQDLGQKGCQTWVDVAGKPLAAALKVTPYAIKVNRYEIAAVLGMNVSSPAEALQAARAVQKLGIQVVVITLGPPGAVLVGPGGAWQATGPEIQAVSNVGSGDAFLGGLMAGLQEGLPEPQALQQATAMGAANALSTLPAVLYQEDYAQMLSQTHLAEIQL